jgi:uncharacterized membrane protein YkvI
VLRTFQRAVMPGLVFESLVIGGGYATGRELVEFFLRHGALAGLLGLIATLIAWSVVLAVTFEFARLTGSFNYRAFFVQLVGRAWIVYDLLYYSMLVLVLSVIGAACSSVFRDAFGLPGWLGAAVLMVCVAVLVYHGNVIVERVLSAWGIALYLLYGGMVIWCLTHFYGSIATNLRLPPTDATWIAGGIAYAGYNLAAAPAMLFCLRHATSRRDALTAGVAGGAFAIIPGILLYLCLVSFYPGITHAPVPAIAVLQRIDSPVFSLIFQVALFITLVKTGVGLLHALNERIAAAFAVRRSDMPRVLRPVAAVAILIFAIVIASRFGIIALVARGYGTITYGFLAIYVVPVLTIGLWRIWRGDSSGGSAASTASHSEAGGRL